MIQAFLHWWLEQLSSLVPAEWRASGSESPDCIVLSEDPPAFVGTLRRRGDVQPLGRFEADHQGAAALGAAAVHRGTRPLAVVLSPPPAQILRKMISLPLAARRNLGQVLEFEMDYETPFRPDEVVWQYRVHRVDRIREKIEVELLLVPRSAIAKACEFIQAAGLRAAMVEIPDGTGRMSRLALQDHASYENRSARRVNLAVAGLAAVLAITAIALPFCRLEHALIEARGEVERLRVVANDTAALQKEIEQLSHATRFMANERARVRDSLQVLAAATQALPDNTYLTEFSLRGEQARLVGFSPSAANLIAVLAAAAPFRDPTFGAPVVHPDGGKLELFTIRVLLDPTNDE